MTAQSDGTSPSVRSSRVLAACYLALAVIGLVGTWYFNLSYTGGDYLADWFANDAAASVAVDVIVVAVAASLLYVREGRRLGWRLPYAVLFIPLSFAVAVAFALPLFLGLRELRLARTGGGEVTA